MQNGSKLSLDTEASNTNCAFCQRSSITANILQETPTFLIVADHAPLVEGHILIIPKQHYACFGAMPAALDVEIQALKQQVEHFSDNYYAPEAFWNHGIFGQCAFQLILR